MTVTLNSASVLHKKASLRGAFFCAWLVGLAWLGNVGIALADACLPALATEKVSVKKIYDGDTLLLVDGRKVRLLGVNTPETGKKGQPSEPLAEEALAFARRFVVQAKQISLLLERERADRYGRALAHVVDEHGVSLEKSLIERGLGFAVTFPPNLALRQCFQAAEAVARQGKRGVWDHSYYEPRASLAVTDSDTGFRRVRGRVEKVSMREGKTWWVVLEGRVALKIDKAHHDYFDARTVRSLYGKTLEAKGWLTKRKLTESQKKKGDKSFVMAVMHPDMIITGL